MKDYGLISFINKLTGTIFIGFGGVIIWNFESYISFLGILFIIVGNLFIELAFKNKESRIK